MEKYEKHGHETALELVSGADFWCNRHCKTSPVDLEGCWGQVWPGNGQTNCHNFFYDFSHFFRPGGPL